MRMHISACGGLNMARKIAAMCEFFGVRTAWHGPGNVSPIGHAVNTHIDFAVPNFGCGEGAPFSPQLQEIFPGCPERKNGMTYSNDLPGLGIDIDEKAAAKYRAQDAWHRSRRSLLRWLAVSGRNQVVGGWWLVVGW